MTTETFQLSLEAAEAYEERFVPALFGEWAPHLVDAAGVAPGQDVLDVACGTGVVAREVAERQRGQGSVSGVDLSEAMLTVARRLSPLIEWRSGDAGALPFDDDTFEVVLCQAALMFFPDRVAALREMRRVARPGATVAVQVWDRLADQPTWRPLVEVAARHAGPEAIDLLSSYWVCGDRDDLARWFGEAGLTITGITTRLGTARFPSIEQLVRVEVESTPLIERITDAVYERIRTGVVEALGHYDRPDGPAEVPISGHLVIARA